MFGSFAGVRQKNDTIFFIVFGHCQILPRLRIFRHIVEEQQIRGVRIRRQLHVREEGVFQNGKALLGLLMVSMPATDTIVVSEDNDIISDIPERRKMYQGQTPQTFNAMKLRNLYNSLSDDEKNILTDAAKIFVMKGEKVHIVEGEVFNIKITYPYDLRVAEALISGKVEG